MKKKVVAIAKRVRVAKARPGGLTSLMTGVRQLIQTARRNVSRVVDTLQVLTNFEIGRRIVEYEQRGAKRARDGAELLPALSARLTREFGKGFSVTNLKLMRQFFIENQSRIGQQAADQFKQVRKAAGPSIPLEAFQSAGPRKKTFTLSWTRYVGLLTGRNAVPHPDRVWTRRPQFQAVDKARRLIRIGWIALSGLGVSVDATPRALPWAGIGRRFAAEETAA